MSTYEDEKAFNVLEHAVNKAQKSLEQTKNFQPFLIVLNDGGEIELFENEVEDSTESYTLLENTLRERIKEGDVDVMVLAVDTLIPERFVQDVPSSIRLHLEEKSQIDKKISARLLYVPYNLCRVGDSDMFVKLHTPIPVGFPAEYIVD
jgi:peptide subunit release factor 1 (eRF1)